MELGIRIAVSRSPPSAGRDEREELKCRKVTMPSKVLDAVEIEARAALRRDSRVDKLFAQSMRLPHT